MTTATRTALLARAAMHRIKRELPISVDRLTLVLAALGILATLLTMLMRVITHFPFYDECLHAHLLWLLASGRKPHVDFFCNYPVFGYLLTLPYFRLLPDSANSLLALRFLMIGLLIAQGLLFAIHGQRTVQRWMWGLAPFLAICCTAPLGRFFSEYSIDPFACLFAMAALVVMFRPPRMSSLAWAAAFSLLSVLATPKYAMPLFFALCGYLLAVSVTTRKPLASLLAVLLAGGLVLVPFCLLYMFVGISIPKSLQWGYLLMTKVQFHSESLRYDRLAFSVAPFLGRNPVLAVILSIALAGWIMHVKTTRWTQCAAGNGLLIGCLIFVISVHSVYEQYIAPVVVCLSMFAPFACELLKSVNGKRIITGALTISIFIASVMSLQSSFAELVTTPVNHRDAAAPGTSWGPPALEDLAHRQQILRLIPRDEKIVALWLHSPIFRADQTFITADDSPSFIRQIDSRNPELRFFHVSYLMEQLELRPPAFISLYYLEWNYPPGWRASIGDFVARHQDSYTAVGDGLYLRNDLVRRASER